MRHTKNIIYNRSLKCYSVEATQGKWFLLDRVDYHLLEEYNWHCDNNGYIRTNIGVKPNRTSVRIHRLIMNCPDNLVIDHINRKPLDNRRCNLEIETVKGNNRNRNKQKSCKSGFTGIELITKKGIVYYKGRICTDQGRKEKVCSLNKHGCKAFPIVYCWLQEMRRNNGYKNYI